ncbi:hypothetical protein NXS15_00185 [Mycoplasma sp. CSL7475-4]|uniref:hypothetical protein n=1 Tax=Mycoplasma sp. CSL7475-4 TaxID=2973942 RepID=UPI00216B19AD|nr:hypothetical protein [Mycoplasma sp. CSL7475-4]MCS4536551.1 hypothetical protein [Mycoplasma sp. CSL7475-4]
MSDKNKKKKIALATLLSTGIPAAALAITIPLLHTNSDLRRQEDTVSYEQLDKVTKQAQDLLKSKNDLSKESITELQKAINYSKQLSAGRFNSDNTDLKASITNMLNQRNKIRSMMPMLLYKDAKSESAKIKATKQLRSIINQ